MGRFLSLLKWLGLALIAFSVFGIAALAIRGSAGVGGYYCLMTLGAAMYLFAKSREVGGRGS